MSTTVKVYRISMEWTVEVNEDDPTKASELAQKLVASGQIDPDAKVSQQFLIAPQNNPNAKLRNDILMRHLLALDPDDHTIIAERMGIRISQAEPDGTPADRTLVIAEIINGSQGRLPVLMQEIRKRIMHYRRITEEPELIRKIAERAQQKRGEELVKIGKLMGLLNPEEQERLLTSKSKLIGMLIGRATEHDNDNVLARLLERVEQAQDELVVTRIEATDPLVRDHDGNPITLTMSTPEEPADGSEEPRVNRTEQDGEQGGSHDVQ